MSFRKQQVESTLKRAISQVLARQLHDPRIEGMISVTRVQVSPDLRDAYVYVSVLPDKHQKKTVAGLRHAAAYIHGLVCKAVALKTVPHLDFRADESIKKESAVLGAIRRGVEQDTQAQAEREKRAAENPAPSETPESPPPPEGTPRPEATPPPEAPPPPEATADANDPPHRAATAGCGLPPPADAGAPQDPTP